MTYENLIEGYEELMFQQITADFRPNIRWKKEVQEWIDYNMHYPVLLEYEVDRDTGTMQINIMFTDDQDATIFKLFWW